MKKKRAGKTTKKQYTGKKPAVKVKPSKKKKAAVKREPFKKEPLFDRQRFPFKRAGKAAAVVLLLLGVFLAVYSYVITNYTITTVYVEGNVHYTNEEIMEMVMEGYYGDNSLILSLKYKDKSIEGVPFIEKMDVSVLDRNTVKIDVYEKALAGYVEYLDHYMYFDKDGIVVESAHEKTDGVPLVTGLSFDHVILHQPLPVEDEGVFKEILSITQLVNKYQLSVNRIYFGQDHSLTLYFDKVKAALGSGSNLEEKIMELQYMLPSLSGKSGTLRMENYTEETKTITFEPD